MIKQTTPSLKHKNELIMERVGTHISGVVSRAFGLPPGRMEFDPHCNRILYSDSKISIGKAFVEKVAASPDFAKELSDEAWQRYNFSLPLAKMLGEAAMNRKQPMEHVIYHFLAHFLTTYSSALDLVFDYETYVKEVAKRIRTGNSYSKETAIIDLSYTIQAPSANNLLFNGRRAKLLHIAHKASVSSNFPGAYTYLDFDWNWYRKNHIPEYENTKVFFVYAKDIRQNLAITEKNLGVSYDCPKTAYEIARENLVSLKSIIRAAQTIRYDASSRLLKMARAGEKEVVVALEFFAGQAVELNETIHTTLTKAETLVSIAAELRGLGKQQLADALIGFRETESGRKFFEEMSKRMQQ
ncbi:MAG: hypothetical protein NT051_03050 [Candidatus Micrarchaeota archaeon]|nr:hypothetical protein [Candidatus Micrarchaeota archaeon]